MVGLQVIGRRAGRQRNPDPLDAAPGERGGEQLPVYTGALIAEDQPFRLRNGDRRAALLFTQELRQADAEGAGYIGRGIERRTVLAALEVRAWRGLSPPQSPVPRASGPVGSRASRTRAPKRDEAEPPPEPGKRSGTPSIC